MNELADYPDANWLETSRYSARYDLGERSAWFCADCGTEIEGDESEGCPACGFGQLEPEEDDA